MKFSLLSLKNKVEKNIIFSPYSAGLLNMSDVSDCKIINFSFRILGQNLDYSIKIFFLNFNITLQ